jgi:superfamily I DNA/RNA helicase
MWNYGQNADVMKALVQLRDNEYVDGMLMAPLLENIPNGLIESDKLILEQIEGKTRHLAESVWHALETERDVVKVADKLLLKGPQRKAIKNVLTRNNYNRKGQIRLGTIHASKGLEADTVMLFPAYSRSLLDDYETDSDTHAEEHRVAYVAATRARDRLYVVRDFFGSKPTMPMFEKPPVREVVA